MKMHKKDAKSYRIYRLRYVYEVKHDETLDAF